MSSNEIGAILLAQARKSVEHAAKHGTLLKVDLNDFPAECLKLGASFVTLEKNENLRGCIGSLTAIEPLIVDVTKNAFQSALYDHRFIPVDTQELPDLTISVAILTPATEMVFDSESDLLSQIRPKIDGLIFEAYGHRGTFLPAVWESLPDPVVFLRHLKMKAGFADDFWDKTVRVYRYETEKFVESSPSKALK